MRRILLMPVALIVLLPAAGTLPHTRALERAVAVTFDDLPATPAGTVANDVTSVTELTRKLLSVVRKYRVPAVGFVNEGKLFVEGAGPRDLESRIAVLRMWLDAGFELGNHTYSHRDYLRYMDEVFAFFEAVSRPVIGREIRQVLLLHASTLNADRFGGLAEALGRRGYRFIPLAEALEDDAYRLPDEFVGAPSNSWFNHWEVTAGRKPVPTPGPPEWIRRAASVH